jgi:hypothetical protein
MSNPLDRLKILINSSIPIVVMETVEEMRAVGLVRSACAELKVLFLSGASLTGWYDPAAMRPRFPRQLFKCGSMRRVTRPIPTPGIEQSRHL